MSQRHRKRMRIQTRSSPWKDSFELDTVGRSLLLARGLLSSDGDMSHTVLDDASLGQLKRSLDTATMWKTHSEQGRIPHSVDTTFALAQVAWRDAQAAQSSRVADPAAPSSIELRMSYAMAILRGINGMADTMQQNRTYAASVAVLCEQIGVPGWLVDVRHEAAHNDLPSLSVLRLAAKTFLGYLEEFYWVPISSVRWEARQAAVELLMSYKAASTNDGLVASPEGDEHLEGHDLSDESSTSEESEIDDASPGWGQSLGTNNNRFAALFEVSAGAPTASKAVRKRTKTSPKREKETKQPETKQEAVSSLHFVRKFVKDVPIDVGYQVALSFLVWGGIGDAPQGRGVLIPGSAATFPASDEGIHRIRQRYSPLLVALCKTWPGCAHAVLVHLVDHVLSIEAVPVEDLDGGSERKLYFLSSWIRFLVSREFHMCHDAVVAVRNGKTNLSKKSQSRWTRDERNFLESPAPVSVLVSYGLPLRSLRDRLAPADKSGIGQYSDALRVMLNGIIGDGAISKEGPADTVTPGNPKIDATASLTATLSLDAMKRMLSNRDKDKEPGNDGGIQATEASTVSKQTAADEVETVWTKCQTWEECAIGSLPGYPV